MKYPWIDEYLLAKPGVTKDLQPDWNWVRYHIGGKMFAAVCRGKGGVGADEPPELIPPNAVVAPGAVIPRIQHPERPQGERPLFQKPGSGEAGELRDYARG